MAKHTRVVLFSRILYSFFLQIPPQKTTRDNSERDNTRERDKVDDDSFFKKGSSDPRFLSHSLFVSLSLSLCARARWDRLVCAEREREKTGVLILFNSCFANFFL